MTGITKLTILLFLTVAIGLCTLFFAYLRVQEEILRDQEESQPHHILRTLERFTEHLSKMEDGAQGYIITGDSTYLEQYSANVGLVGSDFKYLCAFSNRTTTMERCITTFDGLLHKKLFELSSCIELRRTYNMIKPAADFMKKNKSRILRDSIQSIIQELQSEQRTILQQTNATTHQNRFTPLWWAMGGTVTILIFFLAHTIVAYSSERRNIRYITNVIEQMLIHDVIPSKPVSEAFYPLLQAIQSLTQIQRERTSTVSGQYNQLLESLNISPHGFVIARSLRSGSITGKHQITDFELVFGNTTAIRLLSGRGAASAGKRLTELLYPSSLQATLDRYIHTVETGVSTTADEVYHQRFFAVTIVKFEAGLLILYVPHT